MKNFVIVFLFCIKTLYCQQTPPKFEKVKLLENDKSYSEGYQFMGNNDGTWCYYDSSGILVKVVNFKDNQAHGSYIEFYKNGKAKMYGNYDLNVFSTKKYK